VEGGPVLAGADPDDQSVRATARDPWSAPRGRDLLAGVAVLAVLVATLVAFRSDFPPARRSGAPESLAFKTSDPAPPPAPWSEVPILRSVSELPPDLVGPVAEGLAQARSRIDRCVALERRRGARPAPRGPASPAELELRLAAHAGGLQVEGLEVTAPGDAPEVVSCARRMLDGEILTASAAIPGWRQRLAVTLR
jgi:hypothetical protein